MNLGINNLKTEPRKHQEFTCEKSIVVRLWIIIFIGTWLYILQDAFRSGDHLLLLYTCLASAFIYLLVIITVQGESDILIGDDGISRRMFGIIWQNVSWNNVKKIKVFASYNKTKENFRSFNILPIKRPLFSPFGSKIAFDERVGHCHELLETLNSYIEKFHMQKR